MLYVFPTVHGPFVEVMYTRRRRCDLIFLLAVQVGPKRREMYIVGGGSGISFGIHLKFGIRTWWAGPVPYILPVTAPPWKITRVP